MSESVQVVVTECHRSGDFKETDTDFSSFLRLKAQIRAQARGEASWFRTVPSRCARTGWEVKELPGLSLMRTLIRSWGLRPQDLSHLPQAPPPAPPRGAFAFSIRICWWGGGHKSSVHSIEQALWEEIKLQSHNIATCIRNRPRTPRQSVGAVAKVPLLTTYFCEV